MAVVVAVVVAVGDEVVEVVVEMPLVQSPQAKTTSGAPNRTSRHKKSRTPATPAPWADIFPSTIISPSVFIFVCYRVSWQIAMVRIHLDESIP